MSNLVKMVNTIIENKKNSNEVEQASSNMYKQLESAVEEIIIQYPNDPIVNELKQKLVNNLRPILELIRTDQNFDQ
jgi:hypothetical protein